VNATQIASFEEGAGSFFTAANLLNLIQSIGVVVLITYVAWLCVNAYKDYGDETISAGTMITIWMRGIFMLMILLFLLIN
jgi:integrating conjugative element protein (TIGR03758 family)